MRLRRLAIRRMPGIDGEVVLDELGDGVNLVVGPNGSGKTALCRAFRASVWKALEAGHGLSTDAVWTADGDRFSVRRDGDRVTWQRDGVSCQPPDFPDVYTARCFSLEFRDLLLDGSEADETVAVEIRKQISGGYDLERVVGECLGMRPRHGLNEDNRLRERSRDLELVRRAQRELAGRESRRVDLARELDAARVSAARLEPLRAAIELGRVRDRLDSLDRRLAELPAGLALLRGDEDARLGELAEERRALEQSRAECAERVERLERERDRLTPPRGIPGETVIKSQIHRARTLHQLENDVRQAQRAMSEADATRRSAAVGLDAERTHGAAPRVDEGALGEIEAFVERAARARARREQFEDELAASGPGAVGIEERDLDPGIDSLEAWLAARSVRAAGWSRWVVAISLLLLAGAVVLSRNVGDPLLAVASATAGGVLLLVSILGAIVQPAGRRMRAARRRFDGLGLTPPLHWSEEVVRGRLRELRQERSDAAFEARREQRRAELAARLESLEEQLATIEEERKQLRRRFGVDPGNGELAPLRLLQRVETFQQADVRYREGHAALERVRRQQADSLASLNGFVTGVGLAPVSDAASALAALDDLRDRGRRLQHVAEQLDGLARSLEEIDRLADENDEKQQRVFRQADLVPGDERALRSRLASRTEYLSLVEERRSQQARADELGRLAEDVAEAAAFDEETLSALVLEAQQSADRVVALAEELGQIGQAVSAAREGQLLEDALAGVEQASEALSDCRDEALFKTAGRFLVDRVSEEFDRSSRPEILSRAIDLFGRFTHQRFELKVDLSQGTPRFRALEVETGRGKSLAELSAATRVQLLLAARLAYVTHVDPQAILPLLLDEVLATSDPERFVAIADSLILHAREEGRQILYFTADPADVMRWQRVLADQGLSRPEVFDLAAIRGLATGVADDAELSIPPLPRVPLPVDAGADAERYGAMLRVPRVDPSRSVNALHLFHLLRDDLDLLHQLLTARILSVGQWRRLAATDDGPLLIGEGPARRLAALADAAEAFFDSWRVGRGRPVDRSVLLAAGVSEPWTVKLEGLIDELGGHASRLIAALTVRIDDRTKGFHARVRQRLRDQLIAGGYLDERETIGEHEMHARVRAAVAVHVENRILSADEIAGLVHRLLHQTATSGTSDLPHSPIPAGHERSRRGRSSSGPFDARKNP